MLSDIIKQTRHFTTKNSPAILTAVGVVGTLTTAYFSAKGSFQAAEILRRDWETSTLDRELTIQEKAKLVWKEYIPAASTATVTIAAIVSANRIGANRTAAIAAAYTLTERAFGEYKNKVVEKIGETKELRIRDDIAQDQVAKSNVPASLIVNESNKQLCFDSYSGRYFLSTMEEMKSAMNGLNHQIISEDYASLSDFYDRLGLEHTQNSDNLGWNNKELLDLEFTACVSPEQKAALSIRYRVEPMSDFHKFYR